MTIDFITRVRYPTGIRVVRLQTLHNEITYNRDKDVGLPIF